MIQKRYQKDPGFPDLFLFSCFFLSVCVYPLLFQNDPAFRLIFLIFRAFLLRFLIFRAFLLRFLIFRAFLFRFLIFRVSPAETAAVAVLYFIRPPASSGAHFLQIYLC